MPLSDREQELLRLLDMSVEHLSQNRDVGQSTVEPFGALDRPGLQNAVPGLQTV
jgi:hypothetical protein